MRSSVKLFFLGGSKFGRTFVAPVLAARSSERVSLVFLGGGIFALTRALPFLICVAFLRPAASLNSLQAGSFCHLDNRESSARLELVCESQNSGDFKNHKMAQKVKRDRRKAGGPLAKLRWKHVSKSKRTAIASELGRKRWAGIPKSRRRTLMPRSTGRPRLYPPCSRYRAHTFSPDSGRCPCGFVRPAVA